MKHANVITLVLVMVGAVNWGLVGLFQFDLVAALFWGPQAAVSRIIYTLVGVSGLYQILPLLSAISGHDYNPQLATRTGTNHILGFGSKRRTPRTTAE